MFFEKEEEEDVTIEESKVDGVSKSNELYKMYSKVKLEPAFKVNY